MLRTNPPRGDARGRMPAKELHLPPANIDYWTMARSWPLGVIGLCVIMLLLGTSWDIKWHVAVGRDSFWIPPHLMLYAGVALAGLAAGAGVLAETWHTRRVGPRVSPDTIPIGVLRGPIGLITSGVGVATMLAAAPFDDLWHRRYGVDVSIWSPPHMTGVAGAWLIALGGLIGAAQAGRLRRTWGYAGLSLLFLIGLVGVAGIGILPALRPSMLAPTMRSMPPWVAGLYSYAALASLVCAFPLVAAGRLLRRRWAWAGPLAITGGFLALNLLALLTGRLGFALATPWGGQVVVRSPAFVERLLWEQALQIVPPALALALALRALPNAYQRSGGLLGVVVGLGCILAARYMPGGAVSSTQVALDAGIACVAGAIGGMLGNRLGSWLAPSNCDEPPASLSR